MPRIPLVNSRVLGREVDFGRISPESYGAGAFRGIGQLGAVLQEAQMQQDDIEVKRQAVMLDTRLEELKEEIKEEPDFAARERLYQDRATEYLKTASDSITSPAVKNGLNQYYSIKFPREAIKVRTDIHKEWGEARVAQTVDLGDMMADRIVSTDDPQEAAKYQALYKGQLQQLSQGPYAPLNEVQRQRMESAFETKVTTKRAQRMINQNAAGFLVAADEGQFGNLTEDVVYRLREQARIKMEREDAARDKVAREVKGIVTDRWQAKANRGEITPEESAALLSGNVTGITPAEARTLVNVNSEPPMSGGGGTLSVQALASEYYLRPRSIANINATRAKLRALQNDLGRPDPLINKLANELQSDQTTLENQGIARESNEIQRQNREVKQIQTEYEANKPPTPKALQSLLGNQDAQNKAKIEAEYRRNGPEAARKLRDELSKGQKAKTDSIKEKHDAAINW